MLGDLSEGARRRVLGRTGLPAERGTEHGRRADVHSVVPGTVADHHFQKRSRDIQECRIYRRLTYDRRLGTGKIIQRALCDHLGLGL